MLPDVRLTDGLGIELVSGARVVADAGTPAGDVNVLTHAHADHLYNHSPGAVVCSSITASLAAERRSDEPRPTVIEDPRVTLLESGHVAGSTAALVRDDDATVLDTGDVSTRDRLFLNGFDPVAADVLVVESTYGKPEYELPPQRETEAAVVDFFDETMDRPVVAFGYTLGRAQELLLLGDESERDGVYVSETIDRMNAVIEAELPVSFDAHRYDHHRGIRPGELLVLPSFTSRLPFVSDLVERTGAVRVGASGWAVDEGFAYQGDYDEAFALSDHCDFPELLELVGEVDPERVYTTHGFAEELADEITGRLGYEARALKPNQATLDDF